MDIAQDSSGPMMHKCRCSHHKVLPIFVVLFGLVFLLQAYDAVSSRFVEVAWPILVIAAGLTKLFSHRCSCCWGKC